MELVWYSHAAEQLARQATLDPRTDELVLRRKDVRYVLGMCLRVPKAVQARAIKELCEMGYLEWQNKERIVVKVKKE